MPLPGSTFNLLNQRIGSVLSMRTNSLLLVTANAFLSLPFYFDATAHRTVRQKRFRIREDTPAEFLMRYHLFNNCI
jgi:hypothetical protein